MKNYRQYIKLLIASALVAGLLWYVESTKTRLPVDIQPEEIAVPVSVERDPGNTSSASVVSEDDRSAILKEKARKYPSAIEIIPGGRFINSEPFRLRELIGKKVILLDFWTYSCINCIRTLPYLKSWYEKYKDKGLEIVAVHTPEFDFEKDIGNLTKAVTDYDLKYPIVQDNNYATWSAYGNRYWPRKYLIDIDGYIVYDHIGEGAYEETEKLIQILLEERSLLLKTDGVGDMEMVQPKETVSVDRSRVKSPEVYFGSLRNDILGNGQPGVSGVQDLKLPEIINLNLLYLDGRWNIREQFAENLSAESAISFRYSSKNVYLVASSDKGVRVRIQIDGKPIDNKVAGVDVDTDGSLYIKDNRLYHLVNGLDYGEHIFKIIISDPGLRAYTFTFG